MAEIVYESQQAVPEDLRESAKPQMVDGKESGKFVVNVVPRVKLDEFRTNNVQLSKDRDALKVTLDGFTSVINGVKPEDFPAHYSELTGIAQKVKDGQLVASDGLEKAVETRTKQMRADYDGRIAAVEKDRDTWKAKHGEMDSRFERSIVDRAVTNAVLTKESGARPEALPDILSRSYDVFQVDDAGSLKPVDKNGAVIYGSDGSNPMSPTEWLAKLKETAPYFFQSSGGGGAGGGSGAAGGGVTPDQLGKTTMADYRAIRKGGKT